MTPDNTRELIAEATTRINEWTADNQRPSDIGMIVRLRDALAALSAPQEAKSAAKVVPVSYEASASCSHGVCPSGCSHLMWECAACSCEGGWGVSRERLEELAAQHECPSAWGDGDVTDPAFEALEQKLWKHQPVLSMEDGSIRGCQCLDRVFHRGTEDWGTHLAEVFQALSRAAAPEDDRAMQIALAAQADQAVVHKVEGVEDLTIVEDAEVVEEPADG
jgi:hypothetical protein